MLEYQDYIKLNYQIEYYVHQCILLRHQVIHILLILFVYFLCILKQRNYHKNDLHVRSFKNSSSLKSKCSNDSLKVRGILYINYRYFLYRNKFIVFFNHHRLKKVVHIKI